MSPSWLAPTARTSTATAPSVIQSPVREPDAGAGGSVAAGIADPGTVGRVPPLGGAAAIGGGASTGGARTGAGAAGGAGGAGAAAAFDTACVGAVCVLAASALRA